MTEEERVRGRLDDYSAAVGAKDVDAFVAMYADDAVVFDMWGRWKYRGAGEWRAMVEDWFGSLGEESAEAEFRDVETVVGDDIAGLHAILTFQRISATGEKMQSMDNRLTWVLRKERNGGWKVVHEHTSSPIDFETSKPILKA